MLRSTFLDSLLYGVYVALVVPTIHIVIIHDRGRSRIIRCILVIAIYLIATFPVAIRSVFVQHVRHDEIQGTTYIYTPGWMPLSSIAFLVNGFIVNCIAIWWRWFFCRCPWLLIIIPGLCIIIGTTFASLGLYKTITAPLVDNACTSYIDWMLPYYSMSLAITILCVVVVLHCIITSPHIGRETRWLWIQVIVESFLLFAVGPITLLVVYIMDVMDTSCPLVAVTMSTGLAPILAIAQVPCDAVQESSLLVPPEDQVPIHMYIR